MSFKIIATYDNYLVANMTLGLLQENNIRCHLKDENIVTVDPLLNPAVGGIKLMVDEADYTLASELLLKAETDYLAGVPCPHCGNFSLVVEEKTDNPPGFWGKLKNMVAYGQESTYLKFYRCTHCGARVDELPVSG